MRVRARITDPQPGSVLEQATYTVQGSAGRAPVPSPAWTSA